MLETVNVGCPSEENKSDSVRVMEGDFHNITNRPWITYILSDLTRRSPWYQMYVYNEAHTDSVLGWFRDYLWQIRADSSALADRYCDGDTLPFDIRFLTYRGNLIQSHFQECAQVDVHPPRWLQVSYGHMVNGNPTSYTESCFDPQDTLLIHHTFSYDGNYNAACLDSEFVGIGIDTSKIWADFSAFYRNAGGNMVKPDSVKWGVMPNVWMAYWAIPSDSLLNYACQTEDSVTAIIRFHALYDSLAHHDVELYDQDTLSFCGDCKAPFVLLNLADCSCGNIPFLLPKAETVIVPPFNQILPLLHIGPNKSFELMAWVVDSIPSRGMVLDHDHFQIDASSIDATLGWINADETHVLGLTSDAVQCLWYGSDCDHDKRALGLTLTHPYNNGDTITVNYRLEDASGNVDTLWNVAVAIYDSLPAIISELHIISDDSIPEFVTPADTMVKLWADFENEASTGWTDIWDMPSFMCTADLSAFYCGPDASRPDSAEHIRPDVVIQDPANPTHYRAFWGYAVAEYAGVTRIVEHPIEIPVCSQLHYLANRYDATTNVDGIHLNIDGYGLYGFVRVTVSDEACNDFVYSKQFEVSGGDLSVPDVELVEIVTVTDCAVTPGYVSAFPQDTSHSVQVWAWMDTLFTSFDDTVRIDSMQADLTGLSPLDYAGTVINTYDGGMPVYGTLNTLGHGTAYWDTMTVTREEGAPQRRLIAKWTQLRVDTDTDSCGATIPVTVKSKMATGLGGNNNWYADIEHGYALVDTTAPVIYSVRIHNDVTADTDTLWVSPNRDVYVDVFAYDTHCANSGTDHLGFILSGPEKPLLEFCTEAGWDTIWDWDMTAVDITPPGKAQEPEMDYVVIRFTGHVKSYNTVPCNAINENDILGCIKVHIEDCLSNPAVPVIRDNVQTDDAPPYFNPLADQPDKAIPWGDFTFTHGNPGFPDATNVDSVVVLGRGIYNLGVDSVLRVSVIVWDSTWIDNVNTYINFDPFITDAGYKIQHPDSILYNVGAPVIATRLSSSSRCLTVLRRCTIPWCSPIDIGSHWLFPIRFITLPATTQIRSLHYSVTILTAQFRSRFRTTTSPIRVWY